VTIFKYCIFLVLLSDNVPFPPQVRIICVLSTEQHRNMSVMKVNINTHTFVQKHIIYNLKCETAFKDFLCYYFGGGVGVERRH